MLAGPGPKLSEKGDVEESADTGTMKPMTKEEWEKQQSIVRRVYDEDTGRNRSELTCFFNCLDLCAAGNIF